MKYTQKKINVDAFIAMVLVKRLLTPITKTKAYKLKLINRSGDIIKKPESLEEKEALTILDRLVFKMKKTLDSRISEFSKFGYMKTYSDDKLMNYITVQSNIKNDSHVERLNDDLMKVIKENAEILMMEILNEQFNDYLESEHVLSE